MNRDYALRIIGEISDYQKKVAEIPGVTDKQAAAAALKFQNRIFKAQDAAAKHAAKAASDGASAWSKALGGVQLTLDIGKVTSAISSIGGLVQQVADLRNELGDASTRSGVATRTLAGLRLAAEGSGLAFSDLEAGLNALPKRLADAAKGGGEAAGALKALGVSTKNADGGLRSSDEVLQEVIGKLQGIEDPTERAALAMGVFGEAGGKMLQAVGGTELETFSAAAERFGVDVGPAAAQSAGDWQRAMAELGVVFAGAKAKIVDGLNVGGAVESFTLGFVWAQELVSESIAQVERKVALMGDAIDVLTDPAKRSTAAVTELRERFQRLDQEGFATAAAAADDAAKAFWESRKAMRGGAAAADENAAAVGKLGDQHRGAFKDVGAYAAAQREAAEAEKARVHVIEMQHAALEKLIEIGNEATEGELDERTKVVRAYEQQVVAVEAMLGAHQESMLVQAAGERALAELRAKLYRDLEAMQVEALEADEAALDERIANAQTEIEAIAEATATADRQVGSLRELGLRYFADLASAADASAEVVTERWEALPEAVAGAAAELTQALIEFREEEVARSIEEAQRETQVRRDQAQALEAQLKAGGKNLTAAEAEELKKRIAAERRAARESAATERNLREQQMAWEKRQAIFGVLVGGARALIKSMAILGPPVPPNAPGIAGAAVVTASTIAQAVMAAKAKPKLHSGTAYVTADRPASDEVDRRLLVGEAVLSRQGASAMGRDAIEAANAGRPMGQTVQVFIGGQAIEPELVRLARGNGAFATLFRGRSSRARIWS